METKIVSDLPPVYSEIYLDALRQDGLRAYVKELNLDAWIRSVDIYLIYGNDEELTRALEIVKSIEI